MAKKKRRETDRRGNKNFGKRICCLLSKEKGTVGIAVFETWQMGSSSENYEPSRIHQHPLNCIIRLIWCFRRRFREDENSEKNRKDSTMNFGREKPAQTHIKNLYGWRNRIKD